MGEKFYYIQKRYVLKLLLNVVITGIEAHVISWNKVFVCLWQRTLLPVISAMFGIAEH
jgi:hypothetical protein